MTQQQIEITRDIIQCVSDSYCDNQQINTYINTLEDLGITKINSQIMCIIICHLGGYIVLGRVLSKCDGPYTLNNIFSALKTDQLNGYSHIQDINKKYWSSYEKAYSLIKQKLI